MVFPLDVDDAWPPVAAESLPFLTVEKGFQLQTAPLFLKDMSVCDVLSIISGSDNIVESWAHLERSLRSTIWLLRLKNSHLISDALDELRGLGCDTVSMDDLGCYSIDVPETVCISDVDLVLGDLNPEAFAIAFPSMRHPE